MARRHFRQERDLRRRSRGSITKSGDLILIVCEGAKTEPTYFEFLRRRWKSYGITVCGEECGSDPRSVVDYAAREKNERKRKARRGGPPPYDQVWCVFDRDQHTRLLEAINKANDNEIEVALSIPCFEYWYLLHYKHTTSPFSDCDSVISELKKHLPGEVYDKATPPLNDLWDRMQTALTNAELVRKNSDGSKYPNPSTGVDLLIRSLTEL